MHASSPPPSIGRFKFSRGRCIYVTFTVVFSNAINGSYMWKWQIIVMSPFETCTCEAVLMQTFSAHVQELYGCSVKHRYLVLCTSRQLTFPIEKKNSESMKCKIAIRRHFPCRVHLKLVAWSKLHQTDDLCLAAFGAIYFTPFTTACSTRHIMSPSDVSLKQFPQRKWVTIKTRVIQLQVGLKLMCVYVNYVQNSIWPTKQRPFKG